MENPHVPRKDDALVITHYNRTPQQEEMLGLQVSRLKKPEECLELVETYLLLLLSWVPYLSMFVLLIQLMSKT